MRAARGKWEFLFASRLIMSKLEEQDRPGFFEMAAGRLAFDPPVPTQTVLRRSCRRNKEELCRPAVERRRAVFMCGTLVGDSGSGGRDSCRSIFNVIPQTAAFSFLLSFLLPDRAGDIIQFGSD